MLFSKNLIKEFQITHKERFGDTVTREEAERDLSMLATLLKIVIKGKEEK